MAVIAINFFIVSPFSPDFPETCLQAAVNPMGIHPT
jgi:hypothetical protein